MPVLFAILCTVFLSIFGIDMYERHVLREEIRLQQETILDRNLQILQLGSQLDVCESKLPVTEAIVDPE